MSLRGKLVHAIFVVKNQGCRIPISHTFLHTDVGQDGTSQYRWKYVGVQEAEWRKHQSTHEQFPEIVWEILFSLFCYKIKIHFLSVFVAVWQLGFLTQVNFFNLQQTFTVVLFSNGNIINTTTYYGFKV